MDIIVKNNNWLLRGVECWSADPLPVPCVHHLRAEELLARRRDLWRSLELWARHGPPVRYTGTEGMCVCVINTHTQTHIYKNIYIERERQRKRRQWLSWRETATKKEATVIEMERDSDKETESAQTITGPVTLVLFHYYPYLLHINAR